MFEKLTSKIKEELKKPLFNKDKGKAPSTPKEEGKGKEELKFKINFNPPKPDLPDIQDKTKVDFRYAILAPYSYIHLYWDEVHGEVVYQVEEPNLDVKEKEVLNLLEQGIQELIDISFINVDDKEVLIEYLEKNVNVLIKELGIDVQRASYLKIMYYIYRDFIGLNKIEALMNDPHIEDIECNGKGTPVYIVHRKFGNIKTNIVYENIDELVSFVEKLAQKCGKYVSYASPIMDGRLPSGDRVNATYTEDVTSKGPTFSIRRFTREAWSPIKLMQVGTVSAEIMAYLWLLVENGSNILIVGGTGSGKTSLVNVLASFIKPEARIVTIEDTRELKLIHENWLPSVARAGAGVGEEKAGEITLFDLLKASFRQRPDYVVVGEIRGKEAFVLFQGMASVKGDEKLMLLNHDHPRQISIKDLEKNIKYKALSINPETAKANILPVEAKIRHSPRDKLLKIKTKSGREVVITYDHSLFTYDNQIVPIRGDELKKGSVVLIPGKIPCGYADIGYLNLLEFLPEMRVFAPKYIRKAVSKLGYDKSCEIVELKAISDYYANFSRSKQSSLKVDKFLKLIKAAEIEYDLEDLAVKFLRKSKSFPARFKVTDEFLRLLGYYISDGSINNSGKNSSICLYNKDERILKDMRRCIKKIGLKIRERITDRGFGSATELHFTHKVLFEFINKYCGKGAVNKKIPDFIFGLSKKRIGEFLTGLYNGDGYFDTRRIGYSSVSKELIDSLCKLLLVYGVVGRISKKKKYGISKLSSYEIMLYRYNEMKEFLKYVKPLKGRNIREVVRAINTNRIGDVYLDKVMGIEEIKLKKPEFVYDISVPGDQNFIGGFGGVLLHNSGHSGISTMHADDVKTVIRRLETEPINLSPSLVETLDVICLMVYAKVQGENARKMKAIQEVISVKAGGESEVNVPFMWDPRRNVFMFKRESVAFKKIIAKRGGSMEELNKEFDRRVKLLNKLYQQKIVKFEDVQKIIGSYYKNKEMVLKRFGL
ncbi:MAG: hypothetical protein CMH63_02220 [Nanoarchaeota archaeon]|jgi:flagellar protein FlaI|nr:hypothetical protein [Nanoarchaeota archaeon]|tara:strand:- start:2770 stop:5751 length:2982 start_codon:yes stop_codon:yes gene_type:complete